jgi:hypothetical protein
MTTMLSASKKSMRECKAKSTFFPKKTHFSFASDDPQKALVRLGQLIKAMKKSLIS